MGECQKNYTACFGVKEDQLAEEDNLCTSKSVAIISHQPQLPLMYIFDSDFTSLRDLALIITSHILLTQV